MASPFLKTGLSFAALLLVSGGVAAVGYFVHQQSVAPKTTPTEGTGQVLGTVSTSSPIPNPTASPTPTPVPTSVLTPFPTPPVFHQTTTLPKNTATPKAIATTSTNNQMLQLHFVNTPSEVKVGQQFTVSWQVDGPAGVTGESTKLDVEYTVNQQNGSSHASSSSKTSNSFGSFTVPKTFSTNLSYGQTPGYVDLTATAVVQGQTLTAHQTISLTE